MRTINYYTSVWFYSFQILSNVSIWCNLSQHNQSCERFSVEKIAVWCDTSRFSPNEARKHRLLVALSRYVHTHLESSTGDLGGPRIPTNLVWLAPALRPTLSTDGKRHIAHLLLLLLFLRSVSLPKTRCSDWFEGRRQWWWWWCGCKRRYGWLVTLGVVDRWWGLHLLESDVQICCCCRLRDGFGESWEGGVAIEFGVLLRDMTLRYVISCLLRWTRCFCSWIWSILGMGIRNRCVNPLNLASGTAKGTPT